MKCPVCQRLNLKSRTKVESSCTWMECPGYRYFDIEGKEHTVPTEYITRTHYTCDKGHPFLTYKDSKTTVVMEGRIKQVRCRNLILCGRLTNYGPDVKSADDILEEMGYRPAHRFCWCCCPCGHYMVRLNEFPEHQSMPEN